MSYFVDTVHMTYTIAALATEPVGQNCDCLPNFCAKWLSILACRMLTILFCLEIDFSSISYCHILGQLLGTKPPDPPQGALSPGPHWGHGPQAPILAFPL